MPTFREGRLSSTERLGRSPDPRASLAPGRLPVSATRLVTHSLIPIARKTFQLPSGSLLSIHSLEEFLGVAERELLRDAGGFPPGGRRLRAGLTPASAILSATVNDVFEALERNAARPPRIEVTLCGTRMDRRNRRRGQVLGRDRGVTGISLALEATGVLLEAPRASLERARGR